MVKDSLSQFSMTSSQKYHIMVPFESFIKSNDGSKTPKRHPNIEDR